MKSYRARVYATAAPAGSGFRHLLLGGVREHLSSRMETREMAETFGRTSASINREAGRPAEYEVIEVNGAPEILASEVAP